MEAKHCCHCLFVCLLVLLALLAARRQLIRLKFSILAGLISEQFVRSQPAGYLVLVVKVLHKAIHFKANVIKCSNEEGSVSVFQNHC